MATLKHLKPYPQYFLCAIKDALSMLRYMRSKLFYPVKERTNGLGQENLGFYLTPLESRYKLHLFVFLPTMLLLQVTSAKIVLCRQDN